MKRHMFTAWAINPTGLRARRDFCATYDAVASKPVESHIQPALCRPTDMFMTFSVCVFELYVSLYPKSVGQEAKRVRGRSRTHPRPSSATRNLGISDRDRN